MKKTIFTAFVIALAAVFILSAANSFGQSGSAKSLNSAAELQKYLDSQPANSKANPIKVSIKLNESMFW
ncbi:hypothetical protein, partial [Treponema sp. R80B11-R83G3]